MIDCRTGAGSARPVVSMTTRVSACDPAGLQAVDQIGQRVDQVAAHRAAEAAVGELDDAVRRLLDQQMVDRDVAELVDDDGRVGERRILQQPVEQRRLAGAEEAGQHRDRYRMGSSIQRRCRSASRATPDALVGRLLRRAGMLTAPARSHRRRHVRAARSGSARRRLLPAVALAAMAGGTWAGWRSPSADR